MTVARSAVEGRPADVLPFPPAANREALTVAELADLCMAAYTGKDSSRGHYLSQWVELIGTRRVHELDADLVHDALAMFACQPAQRFLGCDKATGRARWKDLGTRGPATLNCLRSALSALLRYAKRQRWLPLGWVRMQGASYFRPLPLYEGAHARGCLNVYAFSRRVLFGPPGLRTT